MSEYYIHTVDTDGDKSRSSFFTGQDLAGLADLLAAFNDATTAKVVRQVLADRSPVTILATPIDGAYDIADKVVFEFLDALGRTQTITIPGPSGGIFQSDDETVDPLSVKAAPFIAAVIAECTARDGTDITSYVRGYRIRRQRKS